MCNTAVAPSVNMQNERPSLQLDFLKFSSTWVYWIYGRDDYGNPRQNLYFLIKSKIFNISAACAMHKIRCTGIMTDLLVDFLYMNYNILTKVTVILVQQFVKNNTIFKALKKKCI